MKKNNLLVALVLLIATTASFAQIGIGTTAPKTTLQVEGNPSSTTTADGVQVPALTLVQLDAKVSAYGTDQDAALVYVNDVSTASTTAETAAITTTGFYYYEASSDTWKKVGGSPATTTTYSVGDFAHGSIVFWVDETGQHGLVCAKVDQSNNIRWYAGTFGLTNAKGDEPYAGKANTSIIIAAHVAIGDDGNTYAARICNELQITEGGKTYGDWYLPSKEELNLIYQNSAMINSTALANGGDILNFGIFYWSSTQSTALYAWTHFFGFNLQQTQDTYFEDGFGVRAVRAF